MRSRERGVLSSLGIAAVLCAALTSGPVAAGEASKTDAGGRMAALMERLSVEQRQAVEEYQAFVARRGAAKITGESAEGRKVGKLGGTALQSVVTRKNADGTTSTRCVESAEEYALFLLGELDGAGPANALQATE